MLQNAFMASLDDPPNESFRVAMRLRLIAATAGQLNDGEGVVSSPHEMY
jgi:hypothetical protein